MAVTSCPWTAAAAGAGAGGGSTSAPRPDRAFRAAPRSGRPRRAAPERGDARAGDRGAKPGHAFGLPRRFELDLVDMGRSDHERGDDADVDEAHHRRLPLTTSW